jgi:hypothetical protein
MLNDKPDGITAIKDVSLSGSIWIDNVKNTATAADINLMAGMAATGITSQVKIVDVSVTCANGTATETAIFTVPKGSLILNVMTQCTEAFNGGTTKTFQVGLTANKDKYIDDVDCGVTLDSVLCMTGGTNNDQKTPEACGSSMAIVSTHTNTAGATTGKMLVRVVYC